MIVTKTVALVEDVETDNPNGAFEVILSAATLDRDGEIIDALAFEPLPDHIPFDIDHGMTVMTTIGSGTPKYNDAGQLVVKGTYASTTLAQEVRTLVSEGHVRTTSVTFMAADREKDSKGIVHVKTAELLNGTFTPVPSNREAVVLSSKSVQALTSNTPTIEVDEKFAKLPEDAKAIIGSLEATRERVSDAVQDTYPNEYAYVRGVLPETVVFDTYDYNSGECQSYQQTYTDDGSVVTLTGLPVKVDVMEVVTSDADASTEPDATEKSAAEAADSAAAKAAAESAAKTADVDAAMSALVNINGNAARLAFGG